MTLQTALSYEILQVLVSHAERMVSMRPPCGEPDAVYGAAMLKLRTNMTLSRTELANCVGVSRQAVREWETGNSYPKVEHLKALIALAVQKHVWASGSEAAEIRLLWKVAHQK